LRKPSKWTRPFRTSSKKQDSISLIFNIPESYPPWITHSKKTFCVVFGCCAVYVATVSGQKESRRLRKPWKWTRPFRTSSKTHNPVFLSYRIPEAFPPWITHSYVNFVLSLPTLQSQWEPHRSRRRTGDCGSTGSEQKRAEYLVRSKFWVFQFSTFLNRIRRGSLFLTNVLSCFWLLCSLRLNELGPEGGKAIAEALKVNQTVTNIK
jgi:hypothetical protein